VEGKRGRREADLTLRSALVSFVVRRTVDPARVRTMVLFRKSTPLLLSIYSSKLTSPLLSPRRDPDSESLVETKVSSTLTSASPQLPLSFLHLHSSFSTNFQTKSPSINLSLSLSLQKNQLSLPRNPLLLRLHPPRPLLPHPHPIPTRTPEPSEDPTDKTCSERRHGVGWA